jgi:hypothetical protein
MKGQDAPAGGEGEEKGGKPTKASAKKPDGATGEAPAKPKAQ